MAERVVADTRDTYARFTPITTRWMDNDVYGHVNNVVYYSWFDTAVNLMLAEHRLTQGSSESVIALVVGTSCQYFESVAYPTPVDIGLRVAKLGNSSVTYELGVFTDGRELAHARGSFTHVFVDANTHRPVPMPARQREVLARYQRAAPHSV